MPTNCVSMKLPRKNNPSIEMKVDLNSKWGKTPKEILHNFGIVVIAWIGNEEIRTF